MAEVDARMVVAYKCPTCGLRNTVGVFDSELQSGFNCKKCDTKWTCNKLIRYYMKVIKTDVVSDVRIDKDLFNEMCVEFTCDCGHNNLIFSRVYKTEVKDISEDMECYTEHAETPSFGLCEACNKGYELKYRLPSNWEDYDDGTFLEYGEDGL